MTLRQISIAARHIGKTRTDNLRFQAALHGVKLPEGNQLKGEYDEWDDLSEDDRQVSQDAMLDAQRRVQSRIKGTK